MLRRGDSFGEMALLEETVRLATVRASSAVQALRLGKSVFAALTRSHPQVREAFQALANGRSLWNFFRVHSGFSQLSNEALALLVSELERVDVPAGEIIVREGDPPGPMYVIEQGRVRVYKHEDGAESHLGVPAHGRLLRRAVAVSERAARRERAGRLGLHAAALPARALPPPARRAPRLPAPARAAHPAVRLPPRRQRAARLRRGDPAGGGDAAAGLPGAGRARARARGGGAGRTPGGGGEAASDPQVPARLPARRDGLRRRLPRDDLPPLRPRGRHLPHPPGRAHVDRRDDAGRDHAGRRGAGARSPLGPRVEEPARRAAAPGGRALGGKPLGRRLPRRRRSTCASPTRPGASAGSRARSSWSAGAATPRWSATRSAWPTRRRHGRASPGSSRSCARTCGWCCSRSGSRSWRRRSSSSCRS